MCVIHLFFYFSSTRKVMETMTFWTKKINILFWVLPFSGINLLCDSCLESMSVPQRIHFHEYNVKICPRFLPIIRILEQNGFTFFHWLWKSRFSTISHIVYTSFFTVLQHKTKLSQICTWCVKEVLMNIKKRKCYELLYKTKKKL